jgi:hypothetical protein
MLIVACLMPRSGNADAAHAVNASGAAFGADRAHPWRALECLL